jgi:polyisoprenyl-phosphate glycosyltransferase
MKKKIRLSIIIPCFNEEKNLSSLFKSIKLISKKNKFVEFILVNNGSTDNTEKIFQLFKHKNVLNVNLKKNIGYGHGIISGVKKSSGQAIAWCHSDLQVKLSDVFAAYSTNEKNIKKNLIIVKGKRINRSFFDNIFTFLMAILVNIYFKVKLNDINAQPKIFSKKIKADIIRKYPKDFSLDLFLLLKANEKKLPIIDYPVTLYEREKGTSKGGGSLIGKIKLIVRTLKFMYKLKMSH